MDDNKRRICQVSPASDKDSPPTKVSVTQKEGLVCVCAKMADLSGNDSDMSENGDNYLTFSQFSRAFKRLEKMLDPIKTLPGLQKTVTELTDSVKLAQDQSKEANDLAQTNSVAVNVLHNEVSDLKAEIQKLKLAQIEADNYSRRENLVFEGVVPNGIRTDYQIRDILCAMGIPPPIVPQMRFQRCHRLMNSPIEPKPVIVRFLSFQDRSLVWAHRKHLGKLQNGKMFLKENFHPYTEARRAKLLPILKAAKKRHDISSVKIVKDKLILNNTTFTCENLSNLPPGLRPSDLCVKEDDRTIVFWGENAVLSNFHPSFFVEGRTAYNCVEQYYSAKKAATFNDDESLKKIMATSDPAEQKRFAKNVANFKSETWMKIECDIMRSGLQLKFDQNPNMKSYLMAKRGKCIGEASAMDKYWGIGKNIFSKDVLNRSNWKGQNNLGKLLEHIRDQY